MKRTYLIYILILGITLTIFYKTRRTNTNEQIVFSTANFAREIRPYANSKSGREIMRYTYAKSATLPPSFCQHPCIILVMVHSKLSNFESRNTIRRTWKQEDKNVYFLLGKTSHKSLQAQISQETNTYGDIIQANVLDIEVNGLVKSVMMLRIATLCKKFKYLLKTDDDTLVSINNIKESLFLRSYPEDLLMGHLVCNSTSIGDSDSKWNIPWYLTGGAYLMSLSVAHKLHQAAYKTPILRTEGVFLTGICAQKAGVQREHSELFARKYVLKKACLLRRVFAVFHLTIEEMRKHYAVLKVYYNMGEVCSKAKHFSSFRWFMGVVFDFTDSPYNYRKICK